MFSKALLVLATASAAYATVFVTAPVASTSYTGGQPAQVTWQDDGNTPNLQQFGPSKISVYAGNAQQQTLLQTINASVDVSTVSTLTFTPDPSIGPVSSEYFIRFESLSLKDAAQPQFPALAFSAKFHLDGMTGVFTADVLSQIAGQSTAPLAAQSTTVAPATNLAATTTAAKTTTTGTTSAKPTTTSKAASGAMSVRAGWATALLSAVVGVTMF